MNTARNTTLNIHSQSYTNWINKSKLVEIVKHNILQIKMQNCILQSILFKKQLQDRILCIAHVQHISTRKAQLMQRGTCNSSACLKAQCEPSNDVSFTLATKHQTTSLVQPYLVSIVFYLFTLARESQTARLVLLGCISLKSQIFPTPSHLVPSLRMTPFNL